MLKKEERERSGSKQPNARAYSSLNSTGMPGQQQTAEKCPRREEPKPKNYVSKIPGIAKQS